MISGFHQYRMFQHNRPDTCFLQCTLNKKKRNFTLLKGQNTKTIFKKWSNSEIKKICLSLTQMEIEGSSEEFLQINMKRRHH